MAPVPFKHSLRYSPLLLVATHLSSVAYLTYAVGDSLYTSYKLLGPVTNTRSRIAQRKRLVPVFLGTAITSWLVATYYSVTFATLSYKTWAYEHGLDLTQRILGENSNYISKSRNSSQLYIGQWLSDTPIYHDALEIVAEKARRFWWGQQIDLATIAFSLMLATEGRRRKIPLLTAFLALAHVVNLSFAQNLFFLALLLTPSPLPSGDGDLKLPVVPLPMSTWTWLRDTLMPPKPNGWVPDTRLFYAAIALNFGSTFILPYAAGTSSFTKVALLVRASTFLPLLLPKIVPVEWGSVQRHPHSSYESTTKLFSFLSAGAFALHAKTSLVALLSNVPDSHYHRHSALLPWNTEERSRWERSTTALGKVLGSTSDHPVVAAVGWDALLCALSLGLWAAVRAINARDMIKSSIPSYISFYNSSLSTPEWTSSDKGHLDDIHHSLEPADTEHDNELRTPVRRWGRRVGSIASSSGASEDAQLLSTPSKRRRGPPRKTKQVAAYDDMDEEPPSSHRSGRSKFREAEEEKAYVPTPAVARSTLEGDELPAQDLDWESASLAWGLAALGGLASACAAVFGGESISR
ncbi:hypothetical protein HD806DRAFT_5827 [Xylariaceae sp. AK1471]|nr:hypothetical protein HD806DRAFT_5827 [Xylariaceae sp. AK1471]